jgi:hypothetical protein
VLVQQDGVTTLTWSDLGAGILYDVAGESLVSLLAGAGTSDAACLAAELPANVWEDTQQDPPPGEGRYYIVRPRDACGPGSYGSSSSGVERKPLAPCGTP